MGRVVPHRIRPVHAPRGLSRRQKIMLRRYHNEHDAEREQCYWTSPVPLLSTMLRAVNVVSRFCLHSDAAKRIGSDG
eukprot:IDg9290t1